MTDVLNPPQDIGAPFLDLRRCDETGHYLKFHAEATPHSDQRWILAEILPAGQGFWHVAVIESGTNAVYTKRPLRCEWVGYQLDYLGVVSATWKAEPAEPTTTNPWHIEPGPKLPRGRDVYFIQGIDGGPIKIGAAQFPAMRLDQIQTMSPVPLRIIGVIPHAGHTGERLLHDLFEDARLHGEWFQPTGELLAFIAKNASQP